ncbi:MAG: hypothetical protein KIG14_02085 [Candidatus Sacchiramonaceae bacterium]|nr:hypothetical protein [Candidatus Saccharimonadaceae bacterium]
MSSAAEILVVILAVALAIFIILAIALVILLIKVTNRINEATKNIRNSTSAIEEITQNIARITSPVVIGKAIFSVFNKFKGKGDK